MQKPKIKKDKYGNVLNPSKHLNYKDKDLQKRYNNLKSKGVIPTSKRGN